MPSPTHVGGLRYHGMAPMLSHLVHHGHVEPRAYGPKECLEAGIQFARTEGIMPAPEATHAIKGAVDEALKCKAEGKSKSICLIFVVMVTLICKRIWIISPAN